MSIHGRSLDDQPLAAYSTGSAPDDDEPELPPDPGYTSVPAPSSSTADLVAEAHAHADAEASESPKSSGSGFRLPFRMPSFGRGKQAALEARAPFQAVTAAAGVGARPFEPVAPRPFQPVAGRPFEPVAPRAPEPVHVPLPGGNAPGIRLAGRRLPKLELRDPRVLAGGTVGVGLVLLVVSLLGGGGPGSGAGGPGSSQNPGGLATAAPVGNASVELTDGGTGLFTLSVSTGGGAAIDSQVAATWTDVTGQSLLLSGLASNGPRTTDAGFVLTWTMLFDGSPVTFTSRAKECTVGMAVGPKDVHGSFVCKKLRSADGKHVIDMKGTYTT